MKTVIVSVTVACTRFPQCVSRYYFHGTWSKHVSSNCTVTCFHDNILKHVAYIVPTVIIAMIVGINPRLLELFRLVLVWNKTKTFRFRWIAELRILLVVLATIVLYAELTWSAVGGWFSDPLSVFTRHVPRLLSWVTDDDSGIAMSLHGGAMLRSNINATTHCNVDEVVEYKRND